MSQLDDDLIHLYDTHPEVVIAQPDDDHDELSSAGFVVLMNTDLDQAVILKVWRDGESICFTVDQYEHGVLVHHYGHGT